MEDLITIKGLVKNLITSISFGIVIPMIIIYGLIPALPISIFNEQLLIANGILFICFYSIYGVFKKDTTIRLFIGIGYIILLIYFYIVGSSVFTFYLPLCNFGVLCINLNLNGVIFSFTLSMWWVCLIIVILKSVNMVRHFIKPIKDQSSED